MQYGYAYIYIRAAASNDPPARIYADNIIALTGADKAVLSSVDTCKFFLKKYAIIEYLLVLPKCHATKIYVTKMSYYQNVCYQNVLLPKRPITKMSSYRNVLLPKCQLPKRPLPKCPLPKCLDTIPSRHGVNNICT